MELSTSYISSIHQFVMTKLLWVGNVKFKLEIGTFKIIILQQSKLNGKIVIMIKQFLLFDLKKSAHFCCVKNFNTIDERMFMKFLENSHGACQ